jgi:hypothetical protein
LRQKTVKDEVAEIWFAPTHDDEEFVNIGDRWLREQVFALLDGVNGDLMRRNISNLNPVASVNPFALFDQLASRYPQNDPLLFGQPNFSFRTSASDNQAPHFITSLFVPKLRWAFAHSTFCCSEGSFEAS